MLNNLTEQEVNKMIAFLDSPEMRSVFAEASESPLSGEKLMSIRLPQGLSGKEMQSITKSICRLFAVYYPIVNEDGIQYWFYPSREIIRLLRTITLDSSDSSAIGNARKTEFRPLLDISSTKAAIDHVFRLSDLPVSPERGGEIIFSDEQLNSDYERIYVNAFHLLQKASELAKQPASYSINFLEQIYRSLIHDTRDPAFERNTYSDATARKIGDALYICTQNWTEIDPLLNAIYLRWSLQNIAAHGQLTLLVVDIYVRQLFIRLGYPLLQFIPFLTSFIPGFSGIRRNQEDDQFVISDGDETHLLTECLKDMSRALEDQLKTYEKIMETEEKARELLHNDRSLNHRQRSILVRALRVPGATFNINYHRATHDIAYSTARADLFNLVKTGYLEVDETKKMHTFMAVENLAEIIEGRKELH